MLTALMLTTQSRFVFLPESATMLCYCRELVTPRCSCPDSTLPRPHMQCTSPPPCVWHSCVVVSGQSSSTAIDHSQKPPLSLASQSLELQPGSPRHCSQVLRDSLCPPLMLRLHPMLRLLQQTMLMSSQSRTRRSSPNESPRSPRAPLYILAQVQQCQSHRHQAQSTAESHCSSPHPLDCPLQAEGSPRSHQHSGRPHLHRPCPYDRDDV